MQTLRQTAVLFALFLFGANSNGQTPTAWWQGEGNFADSIGGLNALTPVSFVPGTNGQAFDFKGGAVSIADNVSLQPVNFTIQMWVKGPNPGSFAYLASKAEGGTFGFYTGSPGSLYLYVETSQGEVFSAGPDESQVNAILWNNQWHQVTGVFDGTNALVYVDGVQQTTPIGATTGPVASPPANVNYPPGNLILGDYTANTGGAPYTGAMDEVRIFNRSLTADEVMDTYTNSSSPALTTGLISWYRGELNANDSAGSNNGTIVRNQIANFSFGIGKHGQGFVPSGGYVAFQDSPALRPTNGVTLQAWVQSCARSSSQYIVSRYQDYALYTGSGGASFFSSGGGNETPANSASEVWDGAFHQLTGVWDGTSNYLYMDGREIASRATPTPHMDFNNPLTFGQYVPSGGFSWTGLLDDVKVYNAALSAAQIKDTFVADLGNQLVSWWRAESNASDSIGANDGSYSAGNYAAGKFAGKSFNMLGGVVVVPDSLSLRVTNITVEALVRAVAPGTNKYIVNKAYNGSGGSYGFSTGPDGGLVFYVTTANGTFDSPALSVPMIWDDNFHGVAGSYDGQNVKLYFDGQQVGSGTPANGQIQYNSGDLTFGDSTGSLDSSNFPGRIDEIRIYNAARTAQEIRADVPTGFTILAQPQSQSVVLGSNYTLSVNARAFLSPIAYQWTHAGTNLPSETNATLNLSGLQAAQLGSYQVKLTGGTARGFTTNVANNLVGKAFKPASYNIYVPNNGSLEVSTFTYQLWVRGAASPGGNKYLMSKSANGNHSAVAIRTLNSAGDLGGYAYIVQTNLFDIEEIRSLAWGTVPGTNVWDGNWHQYTATYDGSSLVNYLDGTLVSSNNILGGGSYSPGGSVQYSDGTDYQNDNLVIAGYQQDSLTFLKYTNDMDEVKVFNRALTSAEVANSYSNPYSNPSGLISWWKGDANDSLDSAGSNNGIFFPDAVQVFETSLPAILTTAAQPALLINASVSGGVFSASVTGTPGQNYVVQKSSSLTSPSWMPVTNGTPTFIFSDPVGVGSSFYRAVAQ